MIPFMGMKGNSFQLYHPLTGRKIEYSPEKLALTPEICEYFLIETPVLKKRELPSCLEREIKSLSAYHPSDRFSQFILLEKKKRRLVFLGCVTGKEKQKRLWSQFPQTRFYPAPLLLKTNNKKSRISYSPPDQSVFWSFLYKQSRFDGIDYQRKKEHSTDFRLRSSLLVPRIFPDEKRSGKRFISFARKLFFFLIFPAGLLLLSDLFFAYRMEKIRQEVREITRKPFQQEIRPVSSPEVILPYLSSFLFPVYSLAGQSVHITRLYWNGRQLNVYAEGENLDQWKDALKDSFPELQITLYEKQYSRSGDSLHLELSYE